jgi:O-antigen/teichoic acid export membrane protein
VQGPREPHGRRPPAARVASGTAARAVGELIAKAASVAFYIAIARELGDARFGDFIFGLSLAQVLLVIAGLGTEELITREVAQEHTRLDELFGDVIAVKGLLLVALWAVVGLIPLVGGYPAETTLAVLLIAAGVGFEYQTKTLYAVFQAHERQHFIAASMITQRTVTALAGIAVLLSGGGLIAVSLVFLAGGVIGLATAVWWLLRFVARPTLRSDRSRWSRLIKTSYPLGLVTVLYLGLVRLDAALLSFLTGGDNATVGDYGAAHRLIEATMFISVAFGGAMLPWMARQQVERRVSPARGYEIGLKVLIALLLPIGLVFGLLAPEWIDLVYGAGYEEAVTPLRLLAVMTVLFGIISFVGIVMIARDRPREFIRPAAVVLAQNVATNLILIPTLGATGAALSSVISGVLLGGWTMWKTQRALEGVSTVRIWASPVLAGGALTGVIVLLGGLTVATMAAATAAYAAVFLVLERVTFPADFGLYQRALGRPTQVADTP